MRSGTITAKRSSVRAQFSKAFVVVGVVVTALSSGACRKSSEEQRREAQSATEEAEQKASQTTITNAEIDATKTDEATEEAREARERALREHAEAITTARNEQLEYRGKLQQALDQLDAKRGEAKKRGQGHKVIDAHREVLKHDLDALDRTTDTEWASMKAKIDRDLKELKDHGGTGEGK
jgi:hypothetical protein